MSTTRYKIPPRNREREGEKSNAKVNLNSNNNKKKKTAGGIMHRFREGFDDRKIEKIEKRLKH